MPCLATEQALLFGCTNAPHTTTSTCRSSQTAATISVRPGLKQIQVCAMQPAHWLCWICYWLRRLQLLPALTAVSACNLQQLSSPCLPLKLLMSHQSLAQNHGHPNQLDQQLHLHRRHHRHLHRHQQVHQCAWQQACLQSHRHAHLHRPQRASGRRPGSLWRQVKLPKCSRRSMHSRQKQTPQLQMPTSRAPVCRRCASGVNSSCQMMMATLTSSSRSCATTQVSALSVTAALA